MAEIGVREPEPRLVEAEINYFAGHDGKPATTIRAPGQRATARRGRFDGHLVAIRDARAIAERLDIDREGFVLARHETKVRDFYDQAEVAAVYEPELEALVGSVTGARRVFVFDHTLRTSSDALMAARGVRDPVRLAHNDYTETSAPRRVVDFLGEEGRALIERRFAVIQVWRSIAGVVRRQPLALCDASSVAPEDLVPTDLVYEDRTGEVMQITWNPRHRWLYFPDMTPGEALVFKTYDSATDGRARWSAHTAFDDPTSPADAPPRESIESRTFAFF